MGSGPKSATLSAASIRKMILTAEEWAEKEGRHIDDVLIGFIYDEKLPARDRIACIKIVKDYTMAKLESGDGNDRFLAPAVYLPEERPDPASITVQ